MRDELEHAILHAPGSIFSFGRVRRLVKWLGLIFLAIFVASTALRAIWAGYSNDNFPEALLVKVELLPLIFPLHMATGGLALLLVPLAFLLRGTRVHKLAGRIAAADVVVAGLTAIPVALTAPVTPLSAAGFASQGMVWLLLISKGIWHIRRREVGLHQNAMMMMAAVTSGALFFRIYLALWSLYGMSNQFKSFYAFDAWIAWALPLGLTWWWISRRRKRRVASV